VIFLFDDPEGYSVFRDAQDWDHAEKLAEENSFKLIGEFVCFVDEETGEKEYIN
jgi:hypothetical protein